jgi:hypothetical protein
MRATAGGNAGRGHSLSRIAGSSRRRICRGGCAGRTRRTRPACVPLSADDVAAAGRILAIRARPGFSRSRVPISSG